MKRWIKLAGLVLAVMAVAALLLAVVRFDTEDVVVAVLDTGIDRNHPWLKGKVIDGYDFASWDTDPSDPDGHGTHVAGIIAREAPEAKLLSVRVITEDDKVRHTALAVLYAVLRGADVVNMSFVEQKHFLTRWAIAFGRFKGVVFVASSGNQGRNEVSYPSKYKGVYSIAAFDPAHGRVVGNVDEKVRYVAPGVNIASASLNGTIATKSGTSMSAGYISGAIAHMKTRMPEWKPARLDDYLEMASREIYVRRDQASAQAGVFRMIDPEQSNIGTGHGDSAEEPPMRVL